MNKLTLDDVLEKKGNMEDALTLAVINFERETGLKVTGIQINVIRLVGVERPQTVAVVTEVVL